MSGQTDQVKGRVKEATGIVTGDKDLEAEGKTDRTIGEAETRIEHAKDKVDDIVDATKAKVEEVADTVTESLKRD